MQKLPWSVFRHGVSVTGSIERSFIWCESCTQVCMYSYRPASALLRVRNVWRRFSPHSLLVHDLLKLVSQDAPAKWVRWIEESRDEAAALAQNSQNSLKMDAINMACSTPEPWNADVAETSHLASILPTVAMLTWELLCFPFSGVAVIGGSGVDLGLSPSMPSIRTLISISTNSFFFWRCSCCAC